MAKTNLTQADALTAMQKRRVNEKLGDFRVGRSPVVLPFPSTDQREQFLFDWSHSRIDPRKVKIHSWEWEVAVLAWLDLRGAPHHNPDGEEIPIP